MTESTVFRFRNPLQLDTFVSTKKNQAQDASATKTRGKQR